MRSAHYTDNVFMKDLPQTAEELRLDVEDLIFNDYPSVIVRWSEKNSEQPVEM